MSYVSFLVIGLIFGLFWQFTKVFNSSINRVFFDMKFGKIHGKALSLSDFIKFGFLMFIGLFIFSELLQNFEQPVNILINYIALVFGCIFSSKSASWISNQIEYE